jgi:hypothetical protein
MKVKSVVTLTPETAVPVQELRDRLSIFADLKSPMAWTGHVRGSPARWKTSDGEVVLEALLAAKANPVTRPVDAVKLAGRPKALKAKIGSVTVPESEETTPITSKEPHTDVQWLLLRLGIGVSDTASILTIRSDRGIILLDSLTSPRTRPATNQKIAFTITYVVTYKIGMYIARRETAPPF